MNRDAINTGHGRGATNMMQAMRTTNRPMKLISLSVLLFFLNASIWPTWAVAVETERQKEIARELAWEQDNRELHQVLKNMREHVGEQRARIEERFAAESGLVNDVLSFFGLAGRREADDRSERFYERLSALHDQTLAAFDQTGEHLRQRALPGVIQDRHEQARERFAARYAELQARLDELNQASSLSNQREAAQALEALLGSFPVAKPRDPFDPDNLPWGTPDPSLTPEPAQNADQLSQRTGLPLFEKGEQLAAHIITPDMLGRPGGPTMADLEPTADITLSDAIVDKAGELDHDPVAIYQWVRNHIEFVPSYGSIQGADYTLQHGKGNAFDTASLLIALLRASNIPARYAFGTVQMPADQVMNWVGNVNTPEAAGNLLGQGGIPNKGLTIGGQIRYFELEHVWAEAWIDYQPSRGAKHRIGDSWIPMDASFKQYEYSEGVDIDQQVPFDVEGFAEQITAQSTINEEEGWVRDLPQQQIEDALNSYRAELEQYLETEHPAATVGEVLGFRDIKTVIRESLSASLPYELVTRKLVTSSLPDNLRWKFRYQLSTALHGQPGTELVSINQPTVALAGKKLALSFSPASEADEDTLASYLPEPDENGEIDPNDIPDTLPGYLIHLRSEFSIGDDIVATASSSTPMGDELISEMGYWQPGRGWLTSRNQPVAGEYRAIALDFHGVSATQAQALQNDLEATQAKLDAEDFTDLSKQQLVGDLLYSTILSYFALNNTQDELAARQAGVVSYRAPSYGLFKTSLQPVYWFGLPRDVRIDGLTMDVDRYSNYRAHKNNDEEQWIAFNRAMGARMSAMEHLVPEEMYSTEDAPAHGISAVKAIQLAAAEGQRIWTITEDNLEQALAASQLSADIRADIRNAVRAGREVTAHERPVDFFGRASAGYVVLDPTTGSGAYLIDGGENGSQMRAGLRARILFSAGIADSIGGKYLKRLGVLNAVLKFFGFISALDDIMASCKVHPAIQFLVILFATVLFAYASYLVFILTAGLSGAIMIILIGEIIGRLERAMTELFARYACAN